MTRLVPIIDISAIRGNDNQAKAALGRQVDAACTSVGFLTVSGHGVPQAAIDAAAQAALEFFDQPLVEKERWMPLQGTILRGYTPPETDTLALSKGVQTPPDIRESFACGRPEVTGNEYPGFPEAQPFYRANIWPVLPAALRPALENYLGCMEVLSRDLMRTFAWALDLDERFFDPLIDRNFTAMHAMHYLPRSTPPLPGQLRAGAHTDFGSLTILHPTLNGGGLQVWSADGTWVDVDPPPSTFVINIGDLMQRWTNDRWVSTLHRVVNPVNDAGWRDRRLSLGHFCHPNFDASIASLPGCIAPGDEAKYPPILAGEYMRKRLLAVRHIDSEATAS